MLKTVWFAGSTVLRRWPRSCGSTVELTDAMAEIDSLYERLRDIVDYADDMLSSRH